MDLLTREEDANYETRFDIDLLTERLEAVTQWLLEEPRCSGSRLGYFGASTGAAAALRAAAALKKRVGAVVSRGGRPDLASEALGQVEAPTLLIVGGLDHVVIELNRRAYEELTGEKDLVLVSGPPICSRNREPSKRSPISPQSGLSATLDPGVAEAIR
jgi:dienelactone hydrolase